MRNIQGVWPFPSFHGFQFSASTTTEYTINSLSLKEMACFNLLSRRLRWLSRIFFPSPMSTCSSLRVSSGRFLQNTTLGLKKLKCNYKICYEAYQQGNPEQQQPLNPLHTSFIQSYRFKEAKAGQMKSSSPSVCFTSELNTKGTIFCCLGYLSRWPWIPLSMLASPFG